jgi:hypothetical protein
MLYSLSNILEIKVTVISENESSESYQQLGKWWMHIDKILGLDIFRRKFSKVHFVETVIITW